MNSFSKNTGFYSNSFQDSSDEESAVKLTSKFHESSEKSSRSPNLKNFQKEAGLIIGNKENMESNRSLMNHMVQIEQKYLDKINLLKERNDELETQILSLVEEKCRLEEGYCELETDYNEIKGERDDLKQITEDQRVRGSEDLRTLNFQFSQQLDALNEKYSNSLAEISRIQTMNTKLKEERNSLMVETERQKTEVNSLRERLDESQRNSSESKAAKTISQIKQELKVIKEEYHETLSQKNEWENEAKANKKKLDETRLAYSALLNSHCKFIAKDLKAKESGRSSSSNGKISSVRILEIYKNEIEKMKCNTEKILENYRLDMRRMGDLLDFQKQKNLELINSKNPPEKLNPSFHSKSRSISNVSCKSLVQNPKFMVETCQTQEYINGKGKRRRGHSSDIVFVDGKPIDRLSGKARSVSRHKFKEIY